MEFVLYAVCLVVGFGLGYYVRDLKKPKVAEVPAPKKRAYVRKAPAAKKAPKAATQVAGSTSAVAAASSTDLRAQVRGMQNDPNASFGRGLENAFGAAQKPNSAGEDGFRSAP